MRLVFQSHTHVAFRFAGIVKSEKTMKKFAESAVKYLRKHKFDGLDLGKASPNASRREFSLSFLLQISNTPVGHDYRATI